MHIHLSTQTRTLQIHRLCITGLRIETPTYPQKRKNVNCISACQIAYEMSDLDQEANQTKPPRDAHAERERERG